MIEKNVEKNVEKNGSGSTITKLSRRTVIVVQDARDETKQFKMETNAKSHAMEAMSDLLKDEKLDANDELIVDIRVLIWKKK